MKFVMCVLLALAPACLAFPTMEGLDAGMYSLNLTTKPMINGTLVAGTWYYDTIILGNGAKFVPPPGYMNLGCAEFQISNIMVNGKPEVDIDRSFKLANGSVGNFSQDYVPHTNPNQIVYSSNAYTSILRAPWTNYMTFLAVYECDASNTQAADFVFLVSRSPMGLSSKIRNKLFAKLKTKGWSSANAVVITPYAHCPT